MSYVIREPAVTYDGSKNLLISEGDGVFSDGKVRCGIEISPVAPGTERLVSRWTNLGETGLSLILELRVSAGFRFTHYLIPGVSYDGNNWGRDKEPKGLDQNGKPWVFSYRRTAIPSCTISENPDEYFCLFASDADARSLTSSCSMESGSDGTMLHRLIYPETEGPVTYCTRDGYEKAHGDTIFLAPGETFRAEAYLLTGKPVKPSFAAASAEDAALKLLGKPFPPRYTPAELSSLCESFALSLLQEVGGKRLLTIGLSLHGKRVFEANVGNEFGWCGQNGMYAKLFLSRFRETGEDKYKEIACGILDAFAETRGKTGLLRAHYDRYLSGTGDVEDTCNLGYVILEYALAWEILQDLGEDRPLWLEVSRAAADFLTEHYSEESGFGKAWNVETGECVDPEGTIGAYVIPGLLELYKITGEEKYLAFAKKGLRLYRKKDLDLFRSTAGALDTYCIDKESSGPLLRSALALYEIERGEEWLETAKMAGWYFTSWMYYFDALYPPESDFARYGFRTLGGTSVSAQHHHIDPWGALCVPDFLRLWKYTGDEGWKTRALLLFSNAMQNVAPREGKTVHGIFRGPGAQNEGYHHCRWGEKEAPGFINDWLVAWPEAFLWNAAREIAAHFPDL